MDPFRIAGDYDDQQAIAESRREARRLKLDTGLPGGVYAVEGSDRLVNANGEEVTLSPEQIEAGIAEARERTPEREVLADTL